MKLLSDAFFQTYQMVTLMLLVLLGSINDFLVSYQERHQLFRIALRSRFQVSFLLLDTPNSSFSQHTNQWTFS
jgi:hypothetical protein